MVVAGAGDLAVSRWLMPVPHPYGDADFDHFLTEIARPGETFVIEDAAGFCGVMGLEEGILGYWLAPASQGKGYATEAARMVLAEHFARSKARVTSGYFADNGRSAHVLRKLGFTETGRDERFCRALGAARAHVVVGLGKADFVAALPNEATSARLTFRSLYPTDAPALHEMVRHRQVTRMLGPKWPWPADPAFAASRARPFSGSGFVWGIFRGGDLIGTVGITGGDLGYALHPDHQRQGLMREACKAALSHAFADLALGSVRAAVWADNAASLSLLRQLGFRVCGAHMGRNALRRGPSPGFDLVLTAAGWRGA